jgi:hypothetical protein
MSGITAQPPARTLIDSGLFDDRIRAAAERLAAEVRDEDEEKRTQRIRDLLGRAEEDERLADKHSTPDSAKLMLRRSAHRGRELARQLAEHRPDDAD